MDFRNAFDPTKWMDMHKAGAKGLLDMYYSNWQSIFPVNSNNSTTINNNYAGTAAIEDTVVKEVASYGTQLGWLSGVVIALAKQSNYTSEDLKHLEFASEQIEKIKGAVNTSLKQRAMDAMTKLEKECPDELPSVVDAFKDKPKNDNCLTRIFPGKCFWNRFFN